MISCYKMNLEILPSKFLKHLIELDIDEKGRGRKD